MYIFNGILKTVILQKCNNKKKTYDLRFDTYRITLFVYITFEPLQFIRYPHSTKIYYFLITIL